MLCLWIHTKGQMKGKVGERCLELVQYRIAYTIIANLMVGKVMGSTRLSRCLSTFETLLVAPCRWQEETRLSLWLGVCMILERFKMIGDQHSRRRRSCHRCRSMTWTTVVLPLFFMWISSWEWMTTEAFVGRPRILTAMRRPLDPTILVQDRMREWEPSIRPSTSLLHSLPTADHADKGSSRFFFSKRFQQFSICLLTGQKIPSRPAWAQGTAFLDAIPTWILSLRPLVQFLVAIVLYWFHIFVMAQHFIAFPFQLIYNERGQFQSIGWDS